MFSHLSIDFIIVFVVIVGISGIGAFFLSRSNSLFRNKKESLEWRMFALESELEAMKSELKKIKHKLDMN